MKIVSSYVVDWPTSGIRWALSMKNPAMVSYRSFGGITIPVSSSVLSTDKAPGTTKVSSSMRSTAFLL